ncbi:MAG TPA: DUF3135 domain-containing protein [Gammaproteobacteria bacterium]|nr:DUF3135 domain-containing protein [Gammaproteobacteria bacterium]
MNTPPARPKFDFDAWVKLARQDPQAFEEKRNRIIEDAIKKAPAHQQQRLRCLQWKLDKIRETSRTPMLACLHINRLLWENVTGTHGLLNSLQQLQSGNHGHSTEQTTAKITPLHP